MNTNHMRILHVLVVEDEARYRDFLLEVLRDMLCEPLGVANAREAQNAIDARTPDVLFLDLNLPVTDGMAFLESFRAKNSDTPVIILTGFGDLQAAQNAIRFGVTEFLTKPCHLGHIERALDRARKQLCNSYTPETAAAPPLDADIVQGEALTLDEIERDAILGALRASNGKRSAAATRLGISRRSLYNKIAEYKRAGFEIP